MRQGIAPVVCVAALTLVASSCSSSQRPIAAHHAGGAPAAASSSGNPPDLTTTIQYSGVYDEKMHYDIVGPLPSGVKAVTRRAHFSWRESVSLTTTGKTLTTPITGTSAIDDSSRKVPNSLTLQVSGSISETDTPANDATCSADLSAANLSGVNWNNRTPGILGPPVEIAIVPYSASGENRTYMINARAVVPASGDTDYSESLIVGKNSTGKDAGNFCKQPGPNGGVMVKDQKCTDLWHPGGDAGLYLPLNTRDFSKNYSCDYTDPISIPATANSDGQSGSDVVSASSTLTVNPAGAAYVALGDSFSSGDFPPFQDDACQRSTGAYPELYDSKVDFLACLARSTAQIAAEQVPNIPANAQVISITAGGDDVNLAGVIAGCAFRLVKNEPCPGPSDLSQSLARAQANLVSIFQTIHHDKAPNAKIYILGYPNPMPKSFERGSCPAIEDLIIHVNPAGIGIANVDMVFFAHLADQINAAARAAAAAGDATYVAPDPSFAQHSVCAARPWFFPLTLEDSPSAQALHPNEFGQRQLEQELFAAAGPAPN